MPQGRDCGAVIQRRGEARTRLPFASITSGSEPAALTRRQKSCSPKPGAPPHPWAHFAVGGRRLGERLHLSANRHCNAVTDAAPGASPHRCLAGAWPPNGRLAPRPRAPPSFPPAAALGSRLPRCQSARGTAPPPRGSLGAVVLARSGGAAVASCENYRSRRPPRSTPGPRPDASGGSGFGRKAVQRPGHPAAAMSSARESQAQHGLKRAASPDVNGRGAWGGRAAGEGRWEGTAGGRGARPGAGPGPARRHAALRRGPRGGRRGEAASGVCSRRAPAAGRRRTSATRRGSRSSWGWWARGRWARCGWAELSGARCRRSPAAAPGGAVLRVSLFCLNAMFS